MLHKLTMDVPQIDRKSTSRTFYLWSRNLIMNVNVRKYSNAKLFLSVINTSSGWSHARQVRVIWSTLWLCRHTKLKIFPWNDRGISRITGPVPGLLVLIWMQFMLNQNRPDAGIVYSAEKKQKVWWFQYVGRDPEITISYCCWGHMLCRKPGGHKIVCTGVKFKSCFNVVKNHTNRFLLLYQFRKSIV